jgi:hypothetical protein
MLDLNLWSKFYWENEINHWENLADELKQNNPKEYALIICKKIQKINDDYFQECSEGSPSYFPCIEIEEKFKKLKKALGDKTKTIPIKSFINQIKDLGSKGIIFFYHFEKQTRLKEGYKIIPFLENYNETIVEYLKNDIIENKNSKEIKIKNRNLEEQLMRILSDSLEENIKFVFDFYQKESSKTWFEKNLKFIINNKTFFVYNINLIDKTEKDLNQWGSFLQKKCNKESLVLFNSNLLAHLNYFKNEKRAIELIQQLPIEYNSAFESLVFSDLNTFPLFEKWYELVLKDEKNERLFFETIWKNKDETMKHSIKLNSVSILLDFLAKKITLDSNSILLDFLAKKMTEVYSKEELKNFDFTKSIIKNENIQELMNKKLSYYYFKNKLTPKNKKTKNMKI